MAKVKVKKIVGKRMVKRKDGTGEFPITNFLTEDDKILEIMGAVKEGEEIEGEISTNQFSGIEQIKRGGRGGGRGMDPATQKSIIRQNALTNSVNRNSAIASILASKVDNSADAQKIIDKYLTGQHIVQVATYLAKYSEGSITVVTESAKEEVPGTPKDEPGEGDEKESSSEDKGEDTGEEEIDVDKIPF